MKAITGRVNLWLQPEFLKLWIGQTISELGSTVTSMALPLTAILLLQANAEQMGFLRAAATLPALIMSLFIGVWVDRMRRRPLLIGADIARMLLLALIPLLAWFNILSIEYLYLIGLLVGFFTVLFDISVTSFLPSLLQREALVEGNSKLQLSSSVLSVTGPGMAGVLIQWMTAPIAIIIDALSFLGSAILLLWIHVPEVPPVQQERQPIWKEIIGGLRALWDIPILRAMTIASTIGSFALSIQQTVFMLHVIHELQLSPIQFGILISCSGIASIIGALLTNISTCRLGLGPAIVVGQLLTSIGAILLACAGSLPFIVFTVLLSGQALLNLGTPIYSVNQLSIRQAIVPATMLGRVNASRRFLVFGIAPFGALFGGLLGAYIGLQLTLWVGAAGLLLSFVWIAFSPVRHVQTLQPG